MQQTHDFAIKLFGKNIAHLANALETDSDDHPSLNSEHSTTINDEESKKSNNVTAEEEQQQQSGTTTYSEETTLKKPDKLLPCPRCNSMDTKFCYYNNYNVNQPRHFCKACQRYWTSGGTVRNMPIGAGRRRNKNSASNYRHINEALQARVSFPIKNRDNCDDGSTGSSSTVSTGIEEEGKNCLQVPSTYDLNGFMSQIPFPWNFAVPSPDYPVSFHPTYWNCKFQGVSNANPQFPTLGKHLRGDENVSVLVPKTLRIDDPSDAAKSSIWTTLGIKNESITSGGLFKPFQSNSHEKNRVCQASVMLQANPAALSRSINFHESS